MTNRRDLGREAIEQIAHLWGVDEDRIERTEHGFDWWPSKFRVSVAVWKADLADQGDAWRLQIRTEFLQGVDLEKAERIKGIALFSHTSPTYAWVYTPAELSREYKIEPDGRIDFWTTAYVREDMVGWLPEFIGRTGILQAIDAHRMADTMGKILHGEPAVSSPGGGPADEHLDEMLNVGASFFVPQGQEPNRFQGLDEYGEFAERFGHSDLFFGTSDPHGLTFETPVGESSALIRLRTDVPHPSLGAGLLASLELPFLKNEAAILDDCLWLNFFESRFWTDFPQMGSWHPRPGSSGLFRAGHAFFVPNALFNAGLATIVALWQFDRARWAKDTLYKDLEELTMAQVLEKRFGGPAEG